MRTRNTPATLLVKIVIMFFLVGFALLILMPLLWMILTGFKTNRELFLAPWTKPEAFHFNNYGTAWKSGIGNYFFNSVIVTVFATALTTTVGCLAAYPLARVNFRGKRIIIYAILGGLMVAPQSAVISLFTLIRQLGLYDQRLGLILVESTFNISFSTFLIMAYYRTISSSLDESAYIDGASSFKIFISIIVPLSQPIIASTIIVCVRSIWNELMYANVLMSSNSKKTIPVGLVNMQGYTTTNWTQLVAGMVITSLPLVLLFLIMQRQFVRGLSAGGVKE
ncbi:carbohydrate ABC transporter permease [uncultured Sphaerochaeta sp.]|uniref:carbohydrate ABC transporter permease n=1 Tax=uncultured Sphaerochaeta sp. TaxID=886478 RepID=UPI002A0A687F|nr:carbohydrate ABC transporter permease [uncultured Sphaerochaeta sp.]